jgi:hypothetical protein
MLFNITNQIMFKNFLDKYKLQIIDTKGNVIHLRTILKKIEILEKKRNDWRLFSFK